MDKIPMTPDGHSALREEYRRRTAEDRPAIIAAISEARSHGDLSENAEYHAAKEQQSLNEGRIQELESLLSASVVGALSRESRVRDGRPAKSCRSLPSWSLTQRTAFSRQRGSM